MKKYFVLLFAIVVLLSVFTSFSYADDNEYLLLPTEEFEKTLSEINNGQPQGSIGNVYFMIEVGDGSSPREVYCRIPSEQYLKEPVRSGYTFKGWKIGEDIFPANSVIKIEQSATFQTDSLISHNQYSRYPSGTKITIDGKALTDYKIYAQWANGTEAVVDNNSDNGSGTTGNSNNEIDDNNTNQNEVLYTITISANAGGIIAPSGDTQVSKGSSLNVSYIPNDGYEIDEVLVDGQKIDNGSYSYSFENITENHSITVHFKVAKSGEDVVENSSSGEKFYTIKSTAGEGGTISPNGEVEVKAGESQFFIITPNDGYEIDKVLINGAQMEVSNQYNFTDIGANHTIDVTFKIKSASQTTVDTTKIIASQWAIEEVAKAQEKDLIPTVYLGSNYTQTINRLEFANTCVKLYEALTNSKIVLSEHPEFVNVFTDTNDEGVIIAYYLGITTGVSADRFAPESSITREQMATMLARTIEVAGLLNSSTTNVHFADESSISDWAKASVNVMQTLGLIQGVGENRFNPLGTATREQTLAIAVRTIAKMLGQ